MLKGATRSLDYSSHRRASRKHQANSTRESQQGLEGLTEGRRWLEASLGVGTSTPNIAAVSRALKTHTWEAFLKLGLGSGSRV